MKNSVENAKSGVKQIALIQSMLKVIRSISIQHVQGKTKNSSALRVKCKYNLLIMRRLLSKLLAAINITKIPRK